MVYLNKVSNNMKIEQVKQLACAQYDIPLQLLDQVNVDCVGGHQDSQGHTIEVYTARWTNPANKESHCHVIKVYYEPLRNPSINVKALLAGVNKNDN